MQSTVSVLKTSPNTILNDYSKLMHLAEYKKYLPDVKIPLLSLICPGQNTSLPALPSPGSWKVRLKQCWKTVIKGCRRNWRNAAPGWHSARPARS